MPKRCLINVSAFFYPSLKDSKSVEKHRIVMEMFRYINYIRNLSNPFLMETKKGSISQGDAAVEFFVPEEL